MNETTLFDLRRRQARLSAAAVLFVLTTAVAFLQPPKPDPDETFQVHHAGWWLYPIEENAFQRLPRFSGRILGFASPPGTETLWAVGTGSLVLKSEDGGGTWRQVSLTFNTPAERQLDFSYVLFFDSLHGWIVGPSGILLLTTDGGETWKRSKTPPGGPTYQLYSLYFSSLEDGWAIGDGLARTTDGGLNWRPHELGKGITWSGLFFLDQKQAWLFGERSIAATLNGGAEWTLGAAPTSSSEGIADLFFLDPRSGWLLGNEGSLYATTDGGKSWVQHTKLVNSMEILPKIRFFNNQRGWIFDPWGFYPRVTKDGGRTWRSATAKSIDLDTSAVLTDQNRGWIGGTNIYRTRDGGLTWERRMQSHSALSPGNRSAASSRPHKIYPAPWYYISLLLVLGLTFMGLRRPPALAEQISVADILASDRPVDATQRDALNLDPVAQALSRFLRNESTQPPLTIAVTGEWGSGKSSLMNLLRDDLRRHGFHPVSFNAWHHQKEEHLLASLLENIRRQAVPAPWVRGGLRYRLRLLWTRGKRAWFLALLVAFGLAWYAGVFLADPSSLTTRLADIEHAVSRIGPWLDVDGKDTPSTPIAATISWWLGLGAVAEALRRGLRSFGIRPAQLLATASSSLKLSALEQQLGFREQFSREFGDVTRALHPRSMVVLIDDLDRCRPENVTEILEAVNFLVSSGECVVVMGLDLDRVERAVGLAFRDVATEMLDASSVSQSRILRPGDGAGDGDPSVSEGAELKLRRQRFARQYLEKLINIEVPVPSPKAEELASLLDVLKKEEPQGRLAGFVLRAAGNVWRWCPAVLVIALLGVGFWVGFEPKAPVDESAPAPAVAAPVPSQPQTSLPAKPGIGPPAAEPDRSPGESRLYPAKPGRRSPWWLALPSGLLALLVIWRAVQAQEDIVQDSPAFARALQTWTPFLFSKRNNPRSAKRFLNRVRYYAMFQRPYVPAVSPLQKLLIRLKLLRAKSAVHPAAPIPEDILVALSAIQHCEREWLSDKTLYTDFVGHLRQEGVPESLLGHREEFQRWGSLEPYRESFERISVGIRVT